MRKFLSFLISISLLTTFSVTGFADNEVLDSEPSTEDFYGTEREFNFDETAPVDRAAFYAEDGDTVWYFGDDIFILHKDKEIIKQNALTGEAETIYSDAGTLDDVYLEPEMAYIMKGHTIYRLHIPSRTMEEVFHDELLKDMFPISNNKFRVSLTSPKWLHYLEETGDNENTVGIPELDLYIVDLLTGEKTPTLGYRGTETSKLPKAVSTGSYGSGTYFTKNGKACNAAGSLKCHTNDNCTWDANSPNAALCNCKIYGSAIQCMGYAKYIYAQNVGGSWGNKEDFSYQNTNSEQRKDAEKRLKELVESLPVGAHIRLRGTHSVAVTGTDSTGFTVIQANADGLNCKVTTGSYTYADLVTGGKSISVNR